MKQTTFTVVITLAASLLLTCCSKKPVEKPDPVKDLFSRLETLVNSGDTNTPITLIEQSIDKPQFAKVRGKLISNLIWMLLKNGKVDEAEQRVLKTIALQPGLSWSPCGVIRNYHMSKGNHDKVLAFAEKLSQVDLPEGIPEQIFEWKLVALIQSGQPEKTIDMIRECLNSFTGNNSRIILSRTITNLLGSGHFEAASRFMDKIEALAKDESDLIHICETGRIDMLSLQGKWDDAKLQILSAKEKVPDVMYSSCFRRVIRRATKAEKWDYADRLCAAVMNKSLKTEKTWLAAAEQWLSLAVQQNKQSEFVNKLGILHSSGLPVSNSSSWYLRQFYTVMSSGSSENKSDMLKLGSNISLSITDMETKTQIGVLLIDGSFMLGEYDNALAILQRSVPGKDAHWHETATVKISAHKAEEENRIQDAIKYYRQFMNLVAQEEGSQQNPLSKMKHTPSMTLGFNARRIGRLLASIGDKKNAEATYKEALIHYNKALEEVAPGGSEETMIRSQMAEIPIIQK